MYYLNELDKIRCLIRILSVIQKTLKIQGNIFVDAMKLIYLALIIPLIHFYNFV
jgi:hypothetical protein